MIFCPNQSPISEPLLIGLPSATLAQNAMLNQAVNAVRQEMGLQPMTPKVQIPVAVRMLEQYGTDISLCPVCKKGRLVLLGVYYPSIFTQLKAAAKHTPEGGLRNKASPADTASP